MSDVVKILAKSFEELVSDDEASVANSSTNFPQGQPGSIYNKYGGWPFFYQIIFQLYVELADHPEISYHFIGVDLERLSKLQAQFLCQAIGGPQMYEGRALAPVHSSMGISQFQFSIVAKRFAQIFRDNGLAEDEVKTIMEFVGSHRSEIVTRKMVLIDRIMKPIYELVYRLRRILSLKR